MAETNYDRIKNRSIDEMADYIYHHDDELNDQICKLAERIEKLEGKLSKYKSSECGAEKVRLMADIRSSEALKSVLTVISEEQFLYSLADELIRAGWTRPVKEGETLYTVAFGKVDAVKVTYSHTETILEVRAEDQKLILCDFKDGEGFYTDKKAAERELERRNKDESI